MDENVRETLLSPCIITTHTFLEKYTTQAGNHQ